MRPFFRSGKELRGLQLSQAGSVANRSVGWVTQRGSEDPRSMSLPGILKAAFYLHSQVVLLECVQPAHDNAFVNSQIDHFCSVLGFHKTVVDLKLDQVWPCKRFRTWWLLTSPLIGAVNLQEWSEMGSLADVGRVIPYISKWDPQR